MAKLYYKRITAGITTKVPSLWRTQVLSMLDEAGYVYTVDDEGYVSLVK